MPQLKIVLKNCDVINPGDIKTYLARDGFKALTKAHSLAPKQVVDIIKASGLRGRGGAGFPCGLKWELASQSGGDEKYVICNADEGEVGTFKDRYILAHDPFTLVEAMTIAGYAIGSKKGFIYLRSEYRYILDIIQKAIQQAAGYITPFEIEIRLGAGAYVCGEESALMESIEGKRGEVRYRPPFPPVKGLFGKPTTINNVETLMNVLQIILNGAEWFNSIGTEKSKGTKVFSVSGDVKNPGIYELLLGSKLSELVVGLAQAENVKMVQVGGSCGRLLPDTMLDTPLAFENVLGAGSIIVFNRSRDVLDIIYRTMEFVVEESCGKCSPCREGTRAMLEIIGRVAHGEGRESDFNIIDELSRTMSVASMCGLGQAAPTSVLDSLQYFRSEWDSRIKKERVELRR